MQSLFPSEKQEAQIRFIELAATLVCKEKCNSNFFLKKI